MDEKRIIYVVTSGEYSDYGINAMFSTPELAQAYIDKQDDNSRAYGGYNIEEWELDAEKDSGVQVVYQAQLHTKTGNLSREWHYSSFVKPDHTEADANGIFAWGVSVRSPEHARKLAAEARQRFQRERGITGEQHGN